MGNGMGNLSGITHPTRRGFLQMFGAAVLPKPPIDFGQISDVTENSFGGFQLYNVFDDIFNSVFRTRLELQGEARKTFLTRLNIALSEKGLPIFGEIDLDNQELGKERRNTLRRGFHQSIQNKLQNHPQLEILKKLSIPGAGNGELKVQVGYFRLSRMIEVFGRTGKLEEDIDVSVIPRLRFQVDDSFLEVLVREDRTQILVDRGEIHTYGKIDQHTLDILPGVDSLIHFLKRPIQEVLQIVRKEGLAWKDYVRKEYGYNPDTGRWIDESDNSKNNEFLNSTALTPISYVKNRVYDVTQDTPQYFPLSFAVQKVLGEMELDFEALLREFQNA